MGVGSGLGTSAPIFSFNAALQRQTISVSSSRVVVIPGPYSIGNTSCSVDIERASLSLASNGSYSGHR